MNDHGIKDRVRQAISSAGLAAIAATGPDNVTYLSGATLPFIYSRRHRPVLLLWPAHGEPLVICPAELVSTMRELSWVDELRSYPATADGQAAAYRGLAEALVENLPSGSQVGMDLERVPASMHAWLQNQLGDRVLSGCDDLLRALRMTKTPDEVGLLVDVAERTDHGIQGAIHHVATLNSRTEKYFAEDIRVHCLERQTDLAGYHAVALAASGEHALAFWPLAPKYGVGQERMPQPGEMVRMETCMVRNGYWSDAARMLVMGEMTDQQRAAYADLVRLRDTAVSHLQPGRRCSEVFQAVASEARQHGIELMTALGVGHGVGVTPYEAPYLSGSDNTIVQPGMVLVIDPVVRAPSGEIMRSKDTVVITDSGCKIVGWYKDWREPYITAFTF